MLDMTRHRDIDPAGNQEMQVLHPLNIKERQLDIPCAGFAWYCAHIATAASSPFEYLAHSMTEVDWAGSLSFDYAKHWQEQTQKTGRFDAGIPPHHP